MKIYEFGPIATEKGLCIHKNNTNCDDKQLNFDELYPFLLLHHKALFDHLAPTRPKTPIMKCQFFGDYNSITIDILVTGLGGWQRSVMVVVASSANQSSDTRGQ